MVYITRSITTNPSIEAVCASFLRTFDPDNGEVWATTMSNRISSGSSYLLLQHFDAIPGEGFDDNAMGATKVHDLWVAIALGAFYEIIGILVVSSLPLSLSLYICTHVCIYVYIYIHTTMRIDVLVCTQKSVSPVCVIAQESEYTCLHGPYFVQIWYVRMSVQ